MKKLFTLLCFVVIFSLTGKSIPESGKVLNSVANPTETLTDSRDGKTYETVKICDQTWMAENLAYLPSVNQPSDGSSTNPRFYVYGYNGTDVNAAKATANYTTYGVLYNWPAAINGATSSSANPSGVQGICPEGWHLPSDAEWKQLEMCLGMTQGQADATGFRGTNQGTQMKMSTGWNNNGNGTNSSGFSGLPGGERFYDGNFRNSGIDSYWWSTTEITNSNFWYRDLNFDNSGVFRYINGAEKELGFNVRCVKDTEESFTDSRDGKIYKTVKIGNQWWMAENLAYLPAVSQVTSGSSSEKHYYVFGYDGTSVGEAKATANYSNYGVLYNWTATINGSAGSDSNPSGVQGVCPSGWHLPSDAEWKEMEKTLGMTQDQADATGYRGTDQGSQIKTSNGWTNAGNGTNSSGFSALPGGTRDYNGVFAPQNSSTQWWSATIIEPNSGIWLRGLYYSENGIYRNCFWGEDNKARAFSVRCVKDISSSQADLAPSNFLFSPQTINVGAHPDAVSFRLTNNGPSGLASPNTHVDGTFFLSKNNTFGDGDDIQIGVNGYDFTIASGASEEVTLSATGRSYITIPAGASGDYYVFVRMEHKSPSTLTDPTQENDYAMRTGTIKVETPLPLETHFVKVWPGSGVDHMNINVTLAKLDNVNLEAGDEIAVFDGSLCVGTGVLTATLSQYNVLQIIASSNDGSGNGYTAGHTISFRFWDKSISKEINASEVKYLTGNPSWSTDGKFSVGATAFAELTGKTIETQFIALNAGWNIISSRVVPENKDMKALFQSLINSNPVKLRKVMDESGKTVEDWGSFGGWKNNIGDIQATEGYKVNVSESVNLLIEGTPVILPLDIPLNSGWNIISFPKSVSQNAKSVVQALIDAGKLKKVMDETGKSIEDWGAYGGWTNNIGNFSAGEGYKVNVNSSCTLTITDGGTKSAKIAPVNLPSSHFSSAYNGYGTDHMNINLVNTKASGLKYGDEIGIFDGPLCVGSMFIAEELIMTGNIGLVASCDDQLNTKSNGFTPSHEISIKLFRDGTIYDLNVNPLNNGKLQFAKGGSLFLSIAPGFSISQNLNDGEFTAKCYPNPFIEELKIDINLPEKQNVRVEVFDLLARKVCVLYDAPAKGKLNLRWDGTDANGSRLAPGIYSCVINNQHFKIILTSK